MELIIVSSNRAKIRHIRECIKCISPTMHVRSFLEFAEMAFLQDNEFCELKEQAIQKALYGVQKTGLPCIADETILVISSLDTQKSAFKKKQHWALSNNLLPDIRSIIQSLQGKEGLERSCYLETALALVLPGNPPTVHHILVRQEGSLAEKELGACNFDFDSLFLKHDYNKTLSELPESTRIRISHRRKGLEKLLPFFERYKNSASS